MNTVTKALPSVVEFSDEVFNDFHARSKYIQKNGFCILTKDLVASLANCLNWAMYETGMDLDNASVVEIGAGLGTLTQALNAAGVKTVGYDLNPTNNKYFSAGSAEGIRQGDIHKAISENENCGVFVMSWPNYASSFGFEVAKALPKHSILFVLGEGRGGCTADDDYFNYVEQSFSKLEDLETELNNVHLSWDGIYDRWSVLQKR